MESQICISPVWFTNDETFIQIATKDIFILLLFCMESQIYFSLVCITNSKTVIFPHGNWFDCMVPVFIDKDIVHTFTIFYIIHKEIAITIGIKGCIANLISFIIQNSIRLSTFFNPTYFRKKLFTFKFRRSPWL